MKQIIDRYIEKFGQAPDLENPQTYPELIAWKLAYDRNPLLTILQDKILSCDYVRDKGYGDILIPIYHATDTPEDIPFSELPEKYIVKPNHSSGHWLTVKDGKMVLKKRRLGGVDHKKIVRYANEWLSQTYKDGLEWAYNDIVRKVFVQELIDNKGTPLTDYKFYVFNGRCTHISTMCNIYGRAADTITMFNRNWEKIDVQYDKWKPGYTNRPERLDQMIEIAENLASEINFVRVDLYNVDGKIYFGEYTHYPTSGMIQFHPESFAYELGKGCQL